VVGLTSILNQGQFSGCGCSWWSPIWRWQMPWPLQQRYKVYCIHITCTT